MSKTKRWLYHRCNCPRCSGLVSDARIRKAARAIRAGRLGAELTGKSYLDLDRTSASLAIREQLKQPREQPLLDQLLSAAGVV